MRLKTTLPSTSQMKMKSTWALSSVSLPRFDLSNRAVGASTYSYMSSHAAQSRHRAWRS